MPFKFGCEKIKGSKVPFFALRATQGRQGSSVQPHCWLESGQSYRKRNLLDS